MKHTITTKTEHPKRCIDPVMKYCQGCKYGHIIWPEWVETYEDTFGCSFDVKCIYGLEKTKPTKREIREFEEEYNRIHARVEAEGVHMVDCSTDDDSFPL